MTDTNTVTNGKKRGGPKGPRLPQLTAEKKIMLARGIYRKLLSVPSTERNEVLRMVGEYARKSKEPALAAITSEDFTGSDSGDDELAAASSDDDSAFV